MTTRDFRPRAGPTAVVTVLATSDCKSRLGQRTPARLHTFANPLSKPSEIIRRATLEDLAAIHSWLKDERNREVSGNFFCNWEIIKKSQKDNQLIVYCESPESEPVAFQLGGLIRNGILAVREEYRGKGIGARLVNDCIKRARRSNQPILRVQCSPDTSIPFWEKMGFSPCDRSDNNDCYYLQIAKKLKVPLGVIPTSVTVRFFPQARQSNSSVEPCAVHRTIGGVDSCGVIRLRNRIVFVSDAFPATGEPVFEIEINGESIYCNKAKYEKASSLGLKACRHGYYLDAVTVPKPLQ